MPDNKDWNHESVAHLRRLWAEGVSTMEIGRHIGVSKNAVIGKASRLDLPARPSPIRRTGTELSNQPKRLALRQLKVRRTKPTISAPLTRPHQETTARDAALAAAARHIPPRITATIEHEGCCWPIGEPGTPGFRFCAEPAQPRRPYCTEHTTIATQGAPARTSRQAATL